MLNQFSFTSSTNDRRSCRSSKPYNIGKINFYVRWASIICRSFRTSERRRCALFGTAFFGHDFLQQGPPTSDRKIGECSRGHALGDRHAGGQSIKPRSKFPLQIWLTCGCRRRQCHLDVSPANVLDCQGIGFDFRNRLEHLRPSQLSACSVACSRLHDGFAGCHRCIYKFGNFRFGGLQLRSCHASGHHSSCDSLEFLALMVLVTPAPFYPDLGNAILPVSNFSLPSKERRFCSKHPEEGDGDEHIAPIELLESRAGLPNNVASGSPLYLLSPRLRRVDLALLNRNRLLMRSAELGRKLPRQLLQRHSL